MVLSLFLIGLVPWEIVLSQPWSSCWPNWFSSKVNTPLMFMLTNNSLISRNGIIEIGKISQRKMLLVVSSISLDHHSVWWTFWSDVKKKVRESDSKHVESCVYLQKLGYDIPQQINLSGTPLHESLFVSIRSFLSSRQRRCSKDTLCDLDWWWGNPLSVFKLCLITMVVRRWDVPGFTRRLSP